MSSKNLKSQSRELRGGRLLANCNCTRRNGLQYDCPRSECQGSAVCLTKPHPKCCPALFGNRFEEVSMGKHTNPEGARRTRVLNNGSEYSVNVKHACTFIFRVVFIRRLCNSIWSCSRRSSKSTESMRTKKSTVRSLLDNQRHTNKLIEHPNSPWSSANHAACVCVCVVVCEPNHRT